MSDGWFAMHRGWRDNPLFRGEFSRADAWVYLIENACWKPTRFDIQGKTVTLERGQFCTSMRDLAAAWGWSKSSVERFLTRLKTETMIGTESGTGRLIITICNYSLYQNVADEGGTPAGTDIGTRAGHERDIKEQGNKGTIEEEAKASPSKRERDPKPEAFPCPEGCDPIDWKSLLETRKAQRKPMTEGAYRQILKKLDAWARDGWPPGPILANAAEKGWLTVFETTEMKAAKNGYSGQADRRSAPGDYRERDTRDGFQRSLDDQIFGPGSHRAGAPSGEAERWSDGDAGRDSELPFARRGAVR